MRLSRRVLTSEHDSQPPLGGNCIRFSVWPITPSMALLPLSEKGLGETQGPGQTTRGSAACSRP